MKYKIIFGLYILFGIILFPFYSYRINPDAISYFNIAQNYTLGLNAVNGFWSPLLSWLLIPFFLLHIKPVLAFNTIQLIFGMFTIIAIKRIINKLQINENIRFLTVLFLLPLVLYFVYEPVITPDLLSLCFLLFYFDSVVSKKVNGVFAGIFGALAYFAKTYSFFFFLLHFVLLMTLKRDKNNLIKGLFTFVIIVIPWIVLISAKYHHFTIGNAGTFNFQVNRPGGVDNPQFYDGLIKPEVNAVTSWYDPSYLQIAYHKPATFINEITAWIVIISKNIASTIFNYEGFSIFAFVSVIYCTVKIRKSNNLILLATFILFSAGYCIYHIDDRFIWFGAVMLLLMAANMKVKKEFLFIILLSFTIIPTKRLISNIYFRRDIYIFSKGIHVNGNIASNGDWNNSLYVAYYNNSKYYGITKGDNKEVSDSLNKNNINYFLVWDDGVKYSFLSALKPAQTLQNLTVYKLNSF